MSSVAGGGSRLAKEPRQSGEVGEGVGEEDEGFGSGSTVDGETFEAPVFEGGVTAFGSVAGAVVETFPGGGADGDVTDEAAGLVSIEGEADVEDSSEVGVGVEMGALGGGKGQVFDRENGLRLSETSATAEPLVAMFLEVEAVGGERVAEGADRTTLVVVATEEPLGLVAVGLMGT